MKKLRYICALLGGAAVLTALPVSAVSAAEGVSVSLMNTEFFAEQGSDFTTTLYVPENSAVSDIQAAICFDKECVSFVEAVPCENNDGSVQVSERDGKIYVSYSGVNDRTDRINIAELKFRAADDLEAGKYSFLSIDKSAKNIASSNDGNGGYTDHAVIPSFSAMNIYQYGDADLNGVLMSRDVTYLKQYIVKMREISDTSKMYANAYMDFEADGTTPKLNTKDAALIQQKVVRMDVNLGDRVNVTFNQVTKDAAVPEKRVYGKLVTKSLKAGTAPANIPEVPEITGYEESAWSLSPKEYVKVDFSKIEKDTTVYAWYEEPDEYVKKCRKVVSALDMGFFPEGTYIVDDFELPHKNKFEAYQMLTSSEFEDLDIIWSISSKETQRGISLKNYVVTVPDLNYTTAVTFTANIMFDGKQYGTASFTREIKGKIDLPGPEEFRKVIKSVPSSIDEHYRLPGYMSLERYRIEKGVENVQNVDIKWTVVRNSDGSTADSRVFDPTNNEIIYLKDETQLTLQADFIFDGNVVYTDRISRTIPAKPLEGQLEYAENYIQRYIPSVISGETYLPTSIPLYDLTISWIPDSRNGKVIFGKNENVNGTVYKVADIGPAAEYMEYASICAAVSRNGDRSFPQKELEFSVQLAGNSSEITTGPDGKIPDPALYKALVEIFDKKYGNKDGILTEEEIYDPEAMVKMDYSVELCYKGIKDLKGISYLKGCRSLCLAGNDLSGSSHLGELADFRYLEKLTLSNCELSEIPEEVFANKVLIEGIDLSYNALKNVDFLRPKGDFEYTELKELFLHGNYITDISNFDYIGADGEVHSRIPNVSVLTLSRDLGYLEFDESADSWENFFKNKEDYSYDINAELDITPISHIPRLTALWLANNGIADISALRDCTFLSTLELSNNEISDLSPISSIQSLVCLKLDDNNITDVSPLRKLIYIEILSLSNNRIGNVSGNLDRLSQLEYLDLDNNKLNTFDAYYFPKLSRLYLENQWTYDTDYETGEETAVKTLAQLQNIDTLKNLTELRLNNNALTYGDIEKIRGLTKLKYLSLSGNKIGSLDFLEKLGSLEHLEVANCDLKQFVDLTTNNQATGESVTEQRDNMGYIGALGDLSILDISCNKDISDISGLSTLNRLNVFYANNIRLESAQAVRSMTKLKYLSMQNSGLTDLSFVNTLNLIEYLNLSGHKAAAFNFRNLENCQNITALYMDSCVATDVLNFRSFVNKQKLRYLSLANMNVDSMESIPDMDSLVYLSLRNTGISDFNGEYRDEAGYINSITRFDNLKYIDVADNPELFTKKNLEMLYDFVGEDGRRAIMLYRDRIPAGYVPGVMDPAIEAKVLKNDVDFGAGSENILAAVNAGYPLQDTLNGYDIKWQLEDNDLYYVKDDKLYFRNTTESDASAKLGLTMAIDGLYYRPENPGSNSETPVSFIASIQTTSEKRKNGDRILIGTEYTTSSDSTLDGWILDSDKTEYGGIEWGSWSSWSKTAVYENELRQVEKDPKKEYTAWGNWSGWSKNSISSNDLREVKTDPRQEASTYYVTHYYNACSRNQTSLVDGLKEIGVNAPKVSDRRPIAEKNGISNYTGTAQQNTYLLGLLKDGKLYDWTETCTKYNTVIYYSYRERKLVDVMYYRYRDGVRVPSVYHFHRDVYEDVYEDVITGMTLVVEDTEQEDNSEPIVPETRAESETAGTGTDIPELEKPEPLADPEEAPDTETEEPTE